MSSMSCHRPHQSAQAPISSSIISLASLKCGAQISELGCFWRGSRAQLAAHKNACSLAPPPPPPPLPPPREPSPEPEQDRTYILRRHTWKSATIRWEVANFSEVRRSLECRQSDILEIGNEQWGLTLKPYHGFLSIFAYVASDGNFDLQADLEIGIINQVDFNRSRFKYFDGCIFHSNGNCCRFYDFMSLSMLYNPQENLWVNDKVIVEATITITGWRNDDYDDNSDYYSSDSSSDSDY
eukprot:GEZU01005228.1.p1 GENE.GEZU01005228.1~~GEZU01005228.1.p1  ORF type:complete len:239 (+),score=35.94 GEZU01005228.1:414-1130(+)